MRFASPAAGRPPHLGVRRPRQLVEQRFAGAGLADLRVVGERRDDAADRVAPAP